MELPWATGRRRCWARTPRHRFQPQGRCQLVEGHTGDHALKVGDDTLRWSTDWTHDPR
jgi:hypothetical protein